MMSIQKEDKLKKLFKNRKSLIPINNPKEITLTTRKTTSENLYTEDKLRKLLIKELLKNNNLANELLEEKDPHVEKYSILQNKFFLKKAKQVFNEKIKEYEIVPSNKFHNEKIKKLKEKGIKYIKSSKINIEESLILFELLNNLNPFTKHLKEIKGDSYIKVLTKLIFVFKYEYYNENNIIYHFNDLSDKFYLIINGEVNFLVPNEEFCELTIEEYLLYLMKLRNCNEIYLLNKIIKKNEDKYKLSEKDFDIWIKKAYSTINDIILRKKEKKKREDEERERNKIQMIKKNNLKKKEEEEDEEEKEEKEKEEEEERIRRRYLKKKIGLKNDFPPFTDDEEIEIAIKLEKEIKETFLFIQMSNNLFKKIIFEEKNKVDPEEYINRLIPIKINYGERLKKKYNFIIYKYYIGKKINDGNYFGEMYADDLYNNDQSRRIETIITSKKCDLCVLNKIEFNDLLLDTYEKGRNDLLHYLLNLNVFFNIDLKNFLLNYTKLFEFQKVEYKECLINQSNNFNIDEHYIYFIYDGIFESFSKYSIQDMDNILLKTNLKDIINIKEIETLQNYKEYYIKQDVKFEIFDKGEIFGLNDCVLNNKYLYNVKCSSTKGFVYKIHLSYIKLMINMDNVIKNNFRNFQKMKYNIFYKMLLNQRKTKVHSLKMKYSDFFFSKGDSFEKKNKISHSLENKQKIIKKGNIRLNNYFKIKKKPQTLNSNSSKTLYPISLKTTNDSINLSRNIFRNKLIKNHIKLNLLNDSKINQSSNSKYYLNNTSYNTSNSKRTFDSFINEEKINGIKEKEMIINKLNKKNYLMNNFTNYNNSSLKEKTMNLIISEDKEKNKIEKKRASNFINLLDYDTLNQKYNTLYYFKPKNLNDKNVQLNYQLLINNNSFDVNKKRNNIVKMGNTRTQDLTLKYNSTK